MSEKPAALAMMFTDIAGSTALYEALGDTEAKSQIERCLNTLTLIARNSGGTLVKTIGDEIMCHFPEAENAVQAAMAMQKTLDTTAVTQNKRLQIRIGLHYGRVLHENNDIFGDAVNIAARMANISKAGQIITTPHTVKRLSKRLRSQCRLFDKVRVKGKKETLDIYQVLWAPNEATRIVSRMHSEPHTAANRIELTHRGRQATLKAGSDIFEIGRDAQSDLVVNAQFTSRHHASIQYQRGKFVLYDTSTNGTMVKFQNGESVYLRSEELPLWGKGILSLGEPIKEGDPDLISFNCLSALPE